MNEDIAQKLQYSGTKSVSMVRPIFTPTKGRKFLAILTSTDGTAQ